jgi:hypothetical protein
MLDSKFRACNGTESMERLLMESWCTEFGEMKWFSVFKL